MKDKKKEELEQSFISKLLSSLSEDMLKRLVFSVIFAVPSIRRPFIKAMLITFLLGVLTALALVYALVYDVPIQTFIIVLGWIVGVIGVVAVAGFVTVLLKQFGLMLVTSLTSLIRTLWRDKKYILVRFARWAGWLYFVDQELLDSYIRWHKSRSGD